MELMQLYYFQVIAKHQNITRAAEELNVSQPAVSTVLQRLEKSIDAQLFDRQNRTIVLNDVGRTFLRQVNSILLEVDNAQKEIEMMKDQEDGEIFMSVTSPQFLQGTEEFLHDHPHTKWRQGVHGVAEITEQLENGDIDVAITSPGIYRKNFVSTVLLRDEFLVGMSKNHHLAKQKKVTLEQLAHEKFVLLLKGMPYRNQTDQLFMNIGFEPDIAMECDHVLRKELLKLNAGVTIASKAIQFRHLYDEDTVFLPIEGARMTREIVLVYRKNKLLSKTTNSFIDFLTEYYHRDKI